MLATSDIRSKKCMQMTLSGPFPLYLSSKQMAIELLTALLPALFLERISDVASTGQKPWLYPSHQHHEK